MSEDELLHKHGGVLDLHSDINCWEGWYPLIDHVLASINDYSDVYNKEVRVVQIKEKFGALRIYAEPSLYNEYVWGILHLAERLSKTICERCGEPGELRTDIGWHKTLCLDHYSARKLELAVKEKKV